MKRSFSFWLRRVFASLGFAGYFPWGSGTIGSAIAVVVMWFAKDKLTAMAQPNLTLWYWVVTIALIAVSFYLTSKSREVFGTEDAPQIIFDEFVGQFVTFFLVPLNLRTMVLGFLLFRFFDIVKPYPVCTMEALDEGVGVTMDDVAAGVYANVCLIVILAAYHVVKARLVSL